MVFRIVIAGESQCDMFAEVFLIADYLAQTLPNFCCERIEKQTWLSKINQKNKWHHTGCPLVWKEHLVSGSKPQYIGGASEFFDFCYSYYKFDVYMLPDRYQHLITNFKQYSKKIKQEQKCITGLTLDFKHNEEPPKTSFTVCISRAGNPMAMYLISGLLEIINKERSISKIYVYDDHNPNSLPFLELVERECSYIGTQYPSKVVRYVDKIGVALTNTDLLIILDHVPFSPELSIGGWLHDNKEVMLKLAMMINASASRKMFVIVANLGPACYNATVLGNAVTSVRKKNIVVATSDLGMEIAPIIAEKAEIPLRNMFCPPVWGFVGVNHLIDINTTVHKYNVFDPHERYVRVKNSSLCIGTLTPEMRTLEYLMHFDDHLWITVASKKAKSNGNITNLNKSLAILAIVKSWLFDCQPNDIVSLGIKCNGTFGLSFDGCLSQPAHLVNGTWRPAGDFMLPKDKHINITHLQDIAKLCMKLEKKDLPELVPRRLCFCKTKKEPINRVWVRPGFF
ncbi:putative malate dehydrogenase 1B isoform X2 [Leptidea sinapis]|uniref:putative malate dehydrogenase 1B isoform X2 n=1 Tax=Leptidea sinapis TaxID=189913 RepID=UPI0021C4156A|nr:putative malate dehydrogenase 1B isoform X2 [Leptidea sinapis]